MCVLFIFFFKNQHVKVTEGRWSVTAYLSNVTSDCHAEAFCKSTTAWQLMPSPRPV